MPPETTGHKISIGYAKTFDAFKLLDTLKDVLRLVDDDHYEVGKAGDTKG